MVAWSHPTEYPGRFKNPVHSRLLEVNGHRLHVAVRGSGKRPAVVLLHHGLGSERAWRAQIPVLARAGYRVIAYDRWGYGRSDAREKLSMPYFEDDQADLLALLDRLGIDQAALVGHSDGGTIALYIAARHPERVRALAILAAHAFVDETMITAAQRVYGEYQTDADFQARLHRRQGSNTDTVISGWYHGWSRPENRGWDIRPELVKIHCPALVMQGTEDDHGSQAQAHNIAAAIPGAELVLLPQAGHMLPRENAGEVNRWLLSFLERVFKQEHADVQ